MRLPLRALALVIAVLLAFVLPNAIELATDWWWFGEVGHQQVFSTMLTLRAGLGGIALVLALAWLVTHVKIAARTLPLHPQQVSTPEGLSMSLPARREIETLGTVLAAGASFIAALYAASTWQEVLGWQQGEAFGVADPVLGYDVGFYVFTLPVIEQARSLAMALVALALAGAGAMYLLGGQVAITPFGMRLGERARRHLGLLAALLFVLLALGAWLDRPRILLTPTGIIRGAGYTDVHARLPFALAEMGAASDRRRPGGRLRAHRAAIGCGRRRGALRRRGARRPALRRRRCSASSSPRTSRYARRRTSSTTSRRRGAPSRSIASCSGRSPAMPS